MFSFLKALAAIGLWNNLLEPVGAKTKAVRPNSKILCPTKSQPFLFTSKNSN
jgi:hypothetical protein